MGPGRAQDRTQARVWMAPPRDSNRLLGLSEFGHLTQFSCMVTNLVAENDESRIHVWGFSYIISILLRYY